MRALPLLFALSACAPSGPRICTGTPATAMLTEGYCKNGEPADRCFFDAPPLDGF
jgi:hypothetical protein